MNDIYHKKEKERERERENKIKQQTFVEHIDPNHLKMSIDHQDQQDRYCHYHHLAMMMDRLLFQMNHYYHSVHTLSHRDDAKYQ